MRVCDQARTAQLLDCSALMQAVAQAGTQAFCAATHSLHGQVSPCPAGVPHEIDTVITLTTSTQPVYDEAARTALRALQREADLPAA